MYKTFVSLGIIFLLNLNISGCYILVLSLESREIFIYLFMSRARRTFVYNVYIIYYLQYGIFANDNISLTSDEWFIHLSPQFLCVNLEYY